MEKRVPIGETEREQLRRQGCEWAADADILKADESVKLDNIRDTELCGRVCFGQNVSVRNCVLQDVEAGNDCKIRDSRISGYVIGEASQIADSEMDGGTENPAENCGDGVRLNLLNEAGGRTVTLCPDMSEGMAYCEVFYRQKKELLDGLERIAKARSAREATKGCRVGRACRIVGAKRMTGVTLGDGVTVGQVWELACGRIGNGTTVINGVVGRYFHIGADCIIENNVTLERVRLGHGVQMKNGYSATDMWVGDGSQLLHGEGAAVWAGPHCVSHHRSTLLIGCAMSFYNAGSGTNQSNHAYKLGPVHQGVLERGCKTGSDSYMMLDVRMGAYSLLLGHHEKHFDTGDLPFTYLIGEGGSTLALPGQNFGTAGTWRDVGKWRERGKGIDGGRITYDLLNPYVIGRVLRGRVILRKMTAEPREVYLYKNTRIKAAYAKRGAEIYDRIIGVYLHKAVKKGWLEGIIEETETDKTEWVDVAGEIIEKTAWERQCETWAQAIDEDVLPTAEAKECAERRYVRALYRAETGKTTLDPADAARYEADAQATLNAVSGDAEKEYAAPVGYGQDYPEERDADFAAVMKREKTDALADAVRKELLL